MLCRVPITAAVISLLLVAADVKAAPLYHLIDIGTLGGSEAFTNDVNNSGQVVGGVSLPNGQDSHGFIYSNGQIVIPTLGGTSGGAGAINSFGVVVGQSYTTNNAALNPYRYQTGVTTDLGSTLGTNSLPYDINDLGQIVGNSVINNTVIHGFFWDGSTVHDIGTLGGANSYAQAINATGQIAGSSDPSGSSLAHAFLYSNGMMKDLGALGAPGYSEAVGINASGQIVGDSSSAIGNVNHAFLYSNGVMTDLGTLVNPASTHRSFATAINSSGQIVGHADANPIGHGFLYANNTMYDLNNVLDSFGSGGLTVANATSINDNGWIAADATTSGGIYHAVLLVPVPEPSSCILLAFGVGLFLSARHRRPS